MNYLTALLAFSAVMIVLGTLATVVVEGIQQLVRQRAKDFEKMLTQLFKAVVNPRLFNSNDSTDSSAKEFVQQMIKNPVFNETNPGLLGRIPVLKNLFSTTFEKLTTRQFVEQFAQTEGGKKLQKQLKDARACSQLEKPDDGCRQR